MITFRKFLKESIIDPMQKTLDKAVFLNPDDENAKINPEIKNQVINGIRRFEAICPVHKYYLTGSILSHRYNKDSDLDVEVEILNSDADSDEIVDSLYDTLDALNGSLAGQSTHPINYHLSFVDEDDDLSDDADNIYNFETDSWDKKSKDFHIDPEEFMMEFDDKIMQIDVNAMKIKRDIVDIEMLRQYSKEEIENLLEMVEDRLNDIEDAIDEMVDAEEDIADERRKAFKEVTPEKLEELGTKNALPINIIYKLMERYYYIDLIKKLKSILEDADHDLEEDDVPKIKNAFKKFDSRVDSEMDDIMDKLDSEEQQ